MSVRPVMNIGAFCQTGSGGTPSRTELDRYYGGVIPWVKSGELRESLITATEEHVTDLALKETSVKLVPAGAVLLAMYGATVGRLAILGLEATTNQAVCHIVPDANIADAKYLYHALSAQVPQIVAMGVGGAQPNISQGLIKSLKVFIPSLSDQHRIVAILDQADALRAKRREALAQLDSLKQSVFMEMFGEYRHGRIRWPIEMFEQLTTDTQIGLVRGAEDFGPDFETPYVRMNALGRRGEFFPGLVQRTDATTQELTDYSLRAGDLLFNTRNSKELVGKTALFREQGIYVFNNNLMRIRFKPSIEPEYIAAAFLTPFIQQELETRKSGTTSVFAIYGRELKTLPIPVPPLPLQKTFATRIHAVEALKTQHRAALTELDALFASLQHRAFQGAL
jgi:type I restriction enzyme, S subunit